MNILYFLLTLAVGTAFGIGTAKLKIPGGLLVGAIVGTALLNILFGNSYMPNDTKLYVQIIAGAFIGCIMEKSDLKRMPHIIKPAGIMLISFLILNLTAGFLIWKTSHLDLITSLMSVVPGGISNTPIIAAEMGADATKVAVLQIVRQILGIGVFPSLILLYDIHEEQKKPEIKSDGYKDKRIKSKTKSIPAFICTLFVATIFGFIGKSLHIPAGTFVFAILSVLILKLVFNYAYIPKWLKKAAQVFSGCYLGSTVSLSDVMELRYLVLPLAIIIIGYMANCLITGRIIRKFCGFTRKESMLITTPAGASDMALISSELNVENTDVIILQVVRAVVVMTFFPQIIGLLVNLFE